MQVLLLYIFLYFFSLVSFYYVSLLYIFYDASPNQVFVVGSGLPAGGGGVVGKARTWSACNWLYSITRDYPQRGRLPRETE